MKTIQISHPHGYNKEDLPATVLALGYFDGVHLGHRQVIKCAKEMAEIRGYESAVMTFDPHPSVMLGKKSRDIKYITPLEEKKRLIKDLGINRLYIVDFTHDFANLLPQQFVDQYIIGLNVKHIVAGFDFTYGKLGKGTMDTMPLYSRNEFTQTTIAKLTHNDQKISSTLIRQLLAEGNVHNLPGLLGRYYLISGIVVDGDKRGRTIGFPTANIRLNGNYLTPPTGVYAVRLNVKGQWHQGVCNIGYKPTFNNEEKQQSIEVHIFDFNDTIYGDDVYLEWHKRLRDERKFENILELVQQINLDKTQAISYFEKISEQTCFLS